MKIIKSLSSQGFSAAYVGVISILFTLLVGRVLGPEQFGFYSYVVTIASLYAISQDGGFCTLVFRELTHPTFVHTKDSLVSLALGHNVVFTCVGILILIIFPIESSFLFFLGLIVFGLGKVAAVFSSQIKGNGKFTEEAKWRILVRTFTAGGGVTAVILGYSSVQGIFSGVIVGFCLALCFRPGQCSFRIRVQRLDPAVYKAMLAFVVIDVATVIYFKIDIIMLRQLGIEARQVGFYAAASRILEGLIFVHLPFASVFFRELRERHKNTSQFIRLLSKLMIPAILIPLLVVPFGWHFSEDLLRLCYGAEFVQGHSILNLLLLAFVFMIPNLVLTQSALAINQEYFYAWVTCGAAVLNVTLNYFLIPIHGVDGAVVGTFITEGFLLVCFGGKIWDWRRKRVNIQ